MIVHATSSYPPKLGGLEKVVEVLARTQTKLGEQVSVLTSTQGGTPAARTETFPVTRLRSFVVANTTIMPTAFFHLLRLRRSDVVHLHIVQAYLPEIVWIASYFKKFRYIAHIHLDTTPSGPAGFLLGAYKKIFLKRVLHKASYVIVFTADQKDKIHRDYKLQLNKILIVPNGVGDEFYYDKPRQVHAQPRLLFVGRLNYQKNLHQLLEALDGVSERFETNLVGEGELQEELEQKVKKLQLQNVNFLGRKNGSELHAQYRQSDIFVLPSEREGMPLVLLEAMAMGLPIVATDVTGNKDVVSTEKDGLLVPYNDAPQLQTALLRVGFDTKLYSKLSKNAHATALGYSWDIIARRFLKIYEEIA